MINRHFKVAWRNLLMNKFYSAINIAGLTIGLAIGMLIFLWVQDELSFDNGYTRANTIYRVNSFLGSGTSKRIWDVTQAPVATYALKEIPGIKSAVRIAPDAGHIFSYGDKLLKEDRTAFIDPSFFNMFDCKLLRGNAAIPFPNDQSVIITTSTAKKYFGEQDPIGKIIQKDHQDRFVVSGLVADFSERSSIGYDMLFPMDFIAKGYSGQNFWKSLDTDWGNFGYITFLEVTPGTPIKAIGEKLIAIQAKNAPHIKVSLTENAFQLQPISSIHLYQADGTAAGMQTVKIFTAIALLILLIAAINYVNLSTARAMLRAKEISIRKIIGAKRNQLFIQFIIESILFFLIALFFAFILLAVLLPYYNAIAEKHLHIDFLDPAIWKIVLLTVAGTLAASAIYPALLLSSFKPLNALKGKILPGIGNVAFRKVLVTIQFAFSVTLIIITLVIGRQLKFIREKDPGYDRSQTFSFRTGEMKDHLDVVKAALINNPAIETVTVADNKIVDNKRTTAGVDWDGKDPNGSFIIHHLGIDQNFIPAMKIKLIAGSNFSGSKSDSVNFILNETAVRMTGIKNPIGKRLKLLETEGTIIGVVKDFNTASLKEKIEPTVIYFEPAGRILYVRTKGKYAAAAVAVANSLWDRYNPGFPFEYNFMDEEYDALYKSDQRTGDLFNIFSAIAIIISCLGLFGLATYTIQLKTKEIGIRKVLGATVMSVMVLVSKDFLKLVSLAILIASPIAWWAMRQWLQNFVYRIEISWWIFFFSGVIAIAIAVLTIGLQSVKAALANPVISLRNE
ncbi:MAG: ABC transporter permease [Ferruginibacter sp.]